MVGQPLRTTRVEVSSGLVWFPNPLAAGSQMGTLSSSCLVVFVVVAVVTFFKVVSWIEDEVVVVVVVILIQVVPWIEVLLHTLIDWMRTEGEEGREVEYLYKIC